MSGADTYIPVCLSLLKRSKFWRSYDIFLKPLPRQSVFQFWKHMAQIKITQYNKKNQAGAGDCTLCRDLYL